MRKKQRSASSTSSNTHHRGNKRRHDDHQDAAKDREFNRGFGAERSTQRHGEQRSRPARADRAAHAIPCPKGALMIWGRHAVGEALKNPNRKVISLYMSGDMIDWLDEIRIANNGLGHEASGIKAPEIIKMEKSALTAAMGASLGQDEKAVHQGIVAVAHPLPQVVLQDWLEEIDAARNDHNQDDRQVVMLLDQITDGRNVGAIMRSARAFRATALIAPDRHCPDESGMMLRTASGAAEHIPLIRVVNLARAMEVLQDHGFMLAGMAAQGTAPLSSLADHDRLGIIMGAEGKGLRRLTKEHADLLVRIPIDDEAESLNVSNAAAVALYAAQRGE